MDQAADSGHVPNLIGNSFRAVDEDVTGKKWFDGAHHTSASRPLNAQPRIEHFQSKMPVQVGRGDVFVLRFGPSTVPRVAEVLIHIWPPAFVNAFPWCTAAPLVRRVK